MAGILPVRTIRWSAWEGCESGLEHLEVIQEGDHIVVESVVIGGEDGVSFGIHYELVIDPLWRVREARVATTAGGRLVLIGDGEGHWQVNGVAVPELRDCIDIDILATPFTNTLPIRRLGLRKGEGAAVRVLYVRTPALTVDAARQRYVAIEPGSLYRFESFDDPFTADLPVDADGVVIDYPGLFKRLS
jgi:hypothetical protein